MRRRKQFQGLAAACFCLTLSGLHISSGELSSQEVHHRCRGTLGHWCQDFLYQASVPWKVAPQGQKTCKAACNGVGTCNADTGLCDCPAGWVGDDCKAREKRPCTNAWRSSASIPEPTSSTSLSDKGWTASRCAGVCDEDLGICHCNGTQGRMPAPFGSPPGTAPLQPGRPMILDECAPKVDDFGEPSYGAVEPADLYGPEGWCEAQQPNYTCPCIIDGVDGPLCELRTEQFCINQCSGHGECERGWCRCQPGYYGQDCAKLTQGFPALPEIWRDRPALAENSALPSGQDPPPEPERLRPLIFIYDLPSQYNSRLLQYRSAKWTCSHRSFREDNSTEFSHGGYMVETGLHEMLAQSPHRTLDPAEADFFYVPVYTSCFAWPVFGWADHPWFYGIGGFRVQHMAHMLLGAKRWIEEKFPHWARNGGRDHIWLVTHDEGSCWVPEELRSSIILSHWGRTDPEHRSGTAYSADNYSEPWVVPEMSPLPWNHILGRGVPCFDPNKDLVIPTLRPPQLMHSPLLGFPPLERTTLLFFRGDFRNEDEQGYSRGIRQRLRRLAQENDWRGRHNILIGGSEIEGDYSTLLASSHFCLVVPGDGYSSRAADSILNGCIPVVIMDEVEAPFESILNWAAFSIRVKEADLERLPEILLAVSASEVLALQVGLSHVWHRFVYSTLPLYQRTIQPVIQANRQERHLQAPASLPGPQYGSLDTDDAFQTIMAWLHSQINRVQPAV